MTAEEVFCDLYEKYGDEFNWHILPLTDTTYVSELKKEIGSDHFLYHNKIWAVAKCDSNDDVLFVTDNGSGEVVYYIFHLTYSNYNLEGYPKYETFIGIEMLREYIEEIYRNEFIL